MSSPTTTVIAVDAFWRTVARDAKFAERTQGAALMLGAIASGRGYPLRSTIGVRCVEHRRAILAHVTAKNAIFKFDDGTTIPASDRRTVTPVGLSDWILIGFPDDCPGASELDALTDQEGRYSPAVCVDLATDDERPPVLDPTADLAELDRVAATWAMPTDDDPVDIIDPAGVYLDVTLSSRIDTTTPFVATSATTGELIALRLSRHARWYKLDADMRRALAHAFLAMTPPPSERACAMLRTQYP